MQICLNTRRNESIHTVNTLTQLLVGGVAIIQIWCCLLQLLLEESCVDVAA